MDKMYKVLKDFACALKGDVLKLEDGLYVLDIKTDSSIRYVAIDENTAEHMENTGYLQLLKEPKLQKDSEEDKLSQLSIIIDDLLKEFENKYKTMMEKAEKGEIQPCVKVEAETVYYNVSKILYLIREFINE